MSIPILLIDTVHPRLHEKLAKEGFLITEAYQWTRAEIISKLPNYKGIIIRSRITIDRDIINAGPNLKFIARYGAGMENIDVAYAQSMGIACLHASAGNKDAVAEHVLGMLLSLMNNINRADREVRLFQWNRESNRGEELAGKTIGIIGCGNMGMATAQRFAGFGVKVLGYDKYKTGYSNDFISETSLPTIYSEADVVSLHVPLTHETNMLVNDAWLSEFKKPIYLINTSRGKVLNTGHAVNFLKAGKIKGLCLDVLEYEDTSFEHLQSGELSTDLAYLLASDKTVLTPHIAGWSFQSHIKLAEVLADEIISVMSSKP